MVGFSAYIMLQLHMEIVWAPQHLQIVPGTPALAGQLPASVGTVLVTSQALFCAHHSLLVLISIYNDAFLKKSKLFKNRYVWT